LLLPGTVSGKQLKPLVAEAIKSENEAILKGATPAEYNDKYLASHGKSSLAARLAVAQSRLVLGQTAESTKSLVTDLTDSGYPLKALLQTWKFVQKHFSTADAESFKTAAHTAFPLVSAFQPPKPEAETKNGTEEPAKDN
jgi:hypothetical protein